MTAYRLEATDDPNAFLALAGDHLAQDPVLATVVATMAQRAVDAPRPDHPQWWVSVLDEHGVVVGAAMRTAPFAPYPLYVLPMPIAAARALGRWLHEHDEQPPVTAANGALPATEQVLGELAGLRGAGVREIETDRLWEVTALVSPRMPAGRPRLATSDDLTLVTAWGRAFMPAADEQAGRPPREGEGEHLDEAWAAAKIDGGLVWLWEVDGRPVHLTGHNPPAFGVARVGPVYTPTEHRGHGYASALVAHVSALLLEQGARVCLFTDRQNPVSNGVYARLGYQPVIDMTRLVLKPEEVTTPGPA